MEEIKDNSLEETVHKPEEPVEHTQGAPSIELDAER